MITAPFSYLRVLRGKTTLTKSAELVTIFVCLCGSFVSFVFSSFSEPQGDKRKYLHQVITALYCIALLTGQSATAESHFKAAADHARANRLEQSIQSLRRSFEAGYDKPSRVLSDTAFQPLVSNADSRQSLRSILEQHVRESQITIVARKEPGTHIRIDGVLVTVSNRKPVPNRMIYFFHTDSGGRYNLEHPTGGMGNSNPRLFGYLKTDAHGKFILHTVRPGSYPGTRAFQHIHYEISNGPSSEFLFDDDPLLTSEGRRTATTQGWPILKVRNQGADKVASATITLP